MIPRNVTHLEQNSIVTMLVNCYLKNKVILLLVLFCLFVTLVNINDINGQTRCPNGYHRAADGSCERLSGLSSLDSLKTTEEPSSLQPPQATSNKTESFPMTNQNRLLTYENPLFGFQFQYPSDWPQIEEVSNGVAFTFKEENALAGNAISVVVTDISESDTLQKYLRDYLAQTPGVDYSSLQMNKTEITPEKLPAVRAEFNAGAGPISFGKSIVYITVKDNTEYIILYNFGDSVFQKHLAGFQKMIDSFGIA